MPPRAFAPARHARILGTLNGPGWAACSGIVMDATTVDDAKAGSGLDDQKAGARGLLDEWMSRDDLAKELAVSVDTLSRWETRGFGPPCVRVGRRVLYRRGAVKDWLRWQEERAAGRGRGK